MVPILFGSGASSRIAAWGFKRQISQWLNQIHSRKEGIILLNRSFILDNHFLPELTEYSGQGKLRTYRVTVTAHMGGYQKPVEFKEEVNQSGGESSTSSSLFSSERIRSIRSLYSIDSSR